MVSYSVDGWYGEVFGLPRLGIGTFSHDGCPPVLRCDDFSSGVAKWTTTRVFPPAYLPFLSMYDVYIERKFLVGACRSFPMIFWVSHF